MRLRGIIAAALVALAAGDITAQAPRELVGRVFHRGENDQEIDEKGVQVGMEPSGASNVTNGSGIFRLPLPSYLRPGDRITIRIGKKDWRIRYPLDGEIRVPADPLRHLELIELVPADSKVTWSHDRLEEFISHSMHVAVLEANLKTEAFGPARSRDGRIPEPAHKVDPQRALRDWAAQNGVRPEEAQEEIDRWLSEVNASKSSERQLGLAAYVNHEFEKAAGHFGLAAAEKVAELAQIQTEIEELTSRRKAARYSAALNYESQGLALDLSGRPGSVASYEKALEYISPQEEPLLWARINDHIGSALLSSIIHLNSVKALLTFGKAIAAYREALEVRTGDFSLRSGDIERELDVLFLGSDPFASVNLSRLLNQARILQTAAWQKCGNVSVAEELVESKSNALAAKKLQEYSNCRSEIDALYLDLLRYRRQIGPPLYSDRY